MTTLRRTWFSPGQRQAVDIIRPHTLRHGTIPSSAGLPGVRTADGIVELPTSARWMPVYSAFLKATMSLSPGTRLGHYDVTSLLGEDGGLHESRASLEG